MFYKTEGTQDVTIPISDSSRVHNVQGMMPAHMTTPAYRPNMQIMYTHIKPTLRYGGGEKHADRDDADDADKLFEDAFGDSLLPFPSQPRRNVFIEPASGMKG